MKIYALPCADVSGKRPGRSVEIVPLSFSNLTASTPMQWCRSMFPRGGGNGSSGSISSSIRSSLSILSDGLIPLRIRWRWPITVIGDLGKCLLTAAAVRPGQLSNHHLFIAFIHVLGGMDPTQRCRYAVSFGSVF